MKHSPKRVIWLIPATAYALLLWRTMYGFKSLPIRVLDWVTLAGVLVAWAIVRWKRGAQWPRTPLNGPLLAWCATAALAAAFSINPRNSLLAVWQIWTWAIVLWALVDALRRGWGGALWKALFLVGGIVCLISGMELLSWYFGWPLVPGSSQGWLSIGGLAHPFPPTLHRLSIALANATALSAFIALLIPPAIATLVATQQQDHRKGIGLWLVAALTVEFLSMSRGGWLALITSLPFLGLGAIFSPQFRQWWSRLPLVRGKLLALFSFATVFIFILSAGYTLIVQIRGIDVTGTLRALSGEDVARDSVRIDMWRSALAIFTDRPLTGVGPSAYGTGLRLYRQPLLARDQFAAAHNLYLNVLAEMGVPGLLAGAAFLVTLAWTWWRQWRAATPGSATWWRLLGVGAALIGLGTQSMVDTFLESGIILPTLFFFATILTPAIPMRIAQPSAGRWRWALAIAVV
ncbi:MAG: O-antigen ligase family protein, partial [Anaerolineae bacterium]|nr:O-antigen ligase family protein [Anaerolineae bacterium]